ncbi:MAG: hypothetical protein QGH60_13360 [Phycisphaerae bacterium]|jgi:hypothetical protein|nr:hypothetical protein [Phycisphaerae bacterium]
MTYAKFGIMALVLVAVMIGGCGAAIEKANQAKCRANLNGIMKACAIYAAENKDKYPENLKILMDDDSDLLPADALKCPSDKSQRACSYLYVAPAPDAEEQTLMLCDLKGNHAKVRCVAFKNTIGTRMSEEEFQAALKLPRNAAFAAALEKAGG